MIKMKNRGFQCQGIIRERSKSLTFDGKTKIIISKRYLTESIWEDK